MATRPPHLLCLPMDRSSFLPLYHRKLSFMTFGHSHHHQRAYIASCREPLLDSRIRCCGGHGVRTTAGSVLQWAVQTGWCAYGMWRAEKFYTRYAPLFAEKQYNDINNSVYQLPGHKGTVTAVDFHPKEPISASHLSLFLPISSLITSTLQFLPQAKTGHCYWEK